MLIERDFSKLTARQNYIGNTFYLELNKNLMTLVLLQLLKIIQNEFFKHI